MVGRHTFLDTLVSISIIVLAAVTVRSLIIAPTQGTTKRRAAEESQPVPVTPVSFSNAPIKGDIHAKVGIIVFSDFQCPFCAKFARDTLPTLEKEYVDTGKVFLAFRNNPLIKIHPFSRQARNSMPTRDEAVEASV